jgi:hypothetical protein
MKQPKVDAKTRKLIEQAVAAHSDGHDITITHLLAEVDDEGVEGISLGLRYALSQRPVDVKKSIEMLTAINDAVSLNDDDRFVFVQHYFADKQPIGVPNSAS